jgi:hypothetical protein
LDSSGWSGRKGNKFSLVSPSQGERRGQTRLGWPNKQKRKDTEYMKEHTITLTINVHFNAIDREDAQRIAEDMDIKFIHPDTQSEIENDLIDWEIR